MCLHRAVALPVAVAPHFAHCAWTAIKGEWMPKTRLLPGLASVAMLACLAAPAIAQEPDRIDRITGMANPGGPNRQPPGVKVVSPGALIFASFDRNGDGRVTIAEIEAGAEIAFVAADKNGDGAVTGFEQADWAGLMNSAADEMANAMTFDIDLDRSVTRPEFVAGLKRIAAQIQPQGDLTFADLLQPLSRLNNDAPPGPGFGLGTITGRGSPPGGGRN